MNKIDDYLATDEEIITKIHVLRKATGSEVTWMLDQFWAMKAYKKWEKLDRIISQLDVKLVSYDYLMGVPRYVWKEREHIPSLKGYWEAAIKEATERGYPDVKALFIGIMDWDKKPDGIIKGFDIVPKEGWE